jgi:hypothetical protein
VVVLSVGFGQGSPGAPPQVQPLVRLHHVHAVVPDPATAMSDATGRVDGSVRAILQGHGPAIRKDGQYIVFDRDSSEARGGASACESSIRGALDWVTASGVAVTDRDFFLTAALRGARCVKVGVAAEQPAVVVDHLRARGIEPLARRETEAAYRLASGLIVEILDDPDRPDTHWCPMHPDVRAAGPRTCPRCAMNLVLIPPPQVGEYGLDVTIDSAPGDQIRFGFVVTEPSTGRPVSQFVEVHERLFHLFIISTDLERFAHVHPERQPDGSFVLTQSLPPGEYMLIADVLPQGGAPQILQRAILTPGYRGPVFEPPPRLAPTSREQRVGDLTVRLTAPALAELRPAPLAFEIIDTSTGRPATGLEPYLGAPAHLLVVDDALQLPQHAHPEQSASDSGRIDFDLRFPEAGIYKMWFQFQRSGQVHTVPFVVRVAPL